MHIANYVAAYTAIIIIIIMFYLWQDIVDTNISLTISTLRTATDCPDGTNEEPLPQGCQLKCVKGTLYIDIDSDVNSIKHVKIQLHHKATDNTTPL